MSGSVASSIKIPLWKLWMAGLRPSFAEGQGNYFLTQYYKDLGELLGLISVWLSSYGRAGGYLAGKKFKSRMR